MGVLKAQFEGVTWGFIESLPFPLEELHAIPGNLL